MKTRVAIQVFSITILITFAVTASAQQNRTRTVSEIKAETKRIEAETKRMLDEFEQTRKKLDAEHDELMAKYKKKPKQGTPLWLNITLIIIAAAAFLFQKIFKHGGKGRGGGGGCSSGDSGDGGGCGGGGCGGD